MNTLDYVIIVVIALGALHGLRRGAIRMITTAVALVAALNFAALYYARAGDLAGAQLGVSQNAGAVIGWIAVFLLVFIAIGIVGGAVARVINFVHLGFLDRIGGAVLGAGIATLLMGLAITLMSTIAPDNTPLIRDSRLASPLMAYCEKIDGFIPSETKNAYQQNRDDLKKYWNDNATKGAGLALFPDASPSPSGN